MQKLLDIINELADKYGFEEEEKKRVQDAVFAIENGDHELESEAEDFEDPYSDEDGTFDDDEGRDGYV